MQEWSGYPSPYLLQHLSGKLQLVQLLLVHSYSLGISFGQLLLLERPKGGRGTPQSAPASEATELVPHWVPSHLGLDVLLQGSHSGSLGGRPCLGRLQGAAVGVCLQLVVLSRGERTAGWSEFGGWWSVRESRDWKGEGGLWVERDQLNETAHLEGLLQVLSDSGHCGPVLLPALDLPQQPLPGHRGNQGFG